MHHSWEMSMVHDKSTAMHTCGAFMMFRLEGMRSDSVGMSIQILTHCGFSSHRTRWDLLGPVPPHQHMASRWILNLHAITKPSIKTIL